jgi:hypothetical protein
MTQPVTVINNFFNDSWQDKIDLFLKVQRHAPIWFTNHDYFPKHLVSGIGVMLVSALPNPIDVEIKDYMMEAGYFKRDPSYFAGLVYQGRASSFTHWHKDTKLDWTGMPRSGISIYLNKTWDENWGGWFCWKDNDNDKTAHMICPEYNKAVLLSDDVLHSTTIVNTSVPEPRLSIQIFFERAALADEYQYKRLHTDS